MGEIYKVRNEGQAWNEGEIKKEKVRERGGEGESEREREKEKKR